MSNYYGDYAEDATIYLGFTTNDASGGAVAPSTAFEAADLKIYKNGSATEKTSTNGITMTSPFDAITGLHDVVIDTSNDTGDAGFWTTGADYRVVLSPDETVDGQTIVHIIAEFSIENRGVAGAKAVWDRVLTSANHNIANSAGRRVRATQEYGTYAHGSVFIDTINGTAGTNDYENGTYVFPVDTIADANTIATSIGLSRFEVAPGSSITFAAAQNNQEFNGNNWTIALGGQSISNTHITGANVSGICSGANPPEFHECAIGAVTVPACTFRNCSMDGVATLPAATVYYHSCSGESGFTLDFGVAVANTTVSLSDFFGEIVIDNLGQSGTDVLNISGDCRLTLNASCVGGTLNLDGHITVTDNSSGVTINQDNVTDTAVAIKAKTDSLTFTVAGEVDSNVQSVNDVTITGDGSTTPFNV